MPIIYGLHAAESMLKHQSKFVTDVFFDQRRQDMRIQKILDLAQQQNITCTAIDKKTLDKKSGGERHQGVVLEAEESSANVSLEQLLQSLNKNALLLVLDGVTDPHNLGACLRTADAAGVDAVIIPKDKSATINATVRKVACGAAEVMPIYSVTNLARTLQQLKQWGVWIVGTAGEAEQMIYDIDLIGPTALVMGAEGKGMRRLTREHCDHLAKLPMAGEVSSLNVSVATGICLFEATRQRANN